MMLQEKTMPLKNTQKTRYILSFVGIGLIILAVLLSSLASLVPSNIFKIDLTSNKMHSLGEISKTVSKSVTQNVTVYLVASEGNENESIKTVIERYTKLNKKILTDTLDPDKDENIIAKYHSGTVEENSVIVVSGERSVFIPYSSFFSYGNDRFAYCYQMYSVYAQYGYIDSSLSFSDFLRYYAPSLSLYDGYIYELQLTSAIKLTTSNETQTLYLLTGHDEYGLSQDLKNRLNLKQYEVKTVNLSIKELPSDADCLLLMPRTDITEKEYGIISEYLKNGGKLMLVTSYSETLEYKNLLRLTNEFGLNTDFNGYLCEDDENYNSGKYQGLIVPDVSDSGLADVLKENSAQVILGASTGITATQTEGVTHTPLLTTSPTAYTKVIGESTDSLEFNEETDVRGSYYTAVKAERKSGGSMVWFSSEAIIYDDYDPYCSRGNKLSLIESLSVLTESSGQLDIPANAVSSEVIDVSASYIYTALAIFALLSLAVLSFGIIRYRKSK